MISEFIGLYQTIDRLTSPSTHFPFVVDLPRSFKSSNRSGTVILNIITEFINYILPVILETVDYDKFKVNFKIYVDKLYLKTGFIYYR